MERYVLASLVVLVSVLLAVTPAAAQNPNNASPPPGVPAATGAPVPPNGVQAPEEFGPNASYTVFHAARWTPWSQTPIPKYYSQTGYVGPTDLNGASYWTQLDLPNGASINYVYAVVYDGDTNGQWFFDVHGYEGAPFGGSPNYTSFASGSTGGAAAPGYTAIVLYPDPPVVIREWTDMNGDTVANVVSYNLGLSAWQSDGTNTLRFWGAAVAWHRTISPAPATATFGDVPTGHWAFQFVEALADSGITAGCGGGNYCPDSPITRAEMAVYLASALGLHWPT